VVASDLLEPGLLKRAEKWLVGVLSIAAMARYMASCWPVDTDGLFSMKSMKRWEMIAGRTLLAGFSFLKDIIIFVWGGF